MGAPPAGIPSPLGTYDVFASHLAPGPATDLATLAADQACAAGVRTAVLGGFGGSAASRSLEQGRSAQFYANVMIVISLGAAAPAALVLDMLNGDSFTVPAVLLVANANLMLTLKLAALAVGGVGFNIGVTPTGQAVTARANSLVRYEAYPLGPF